MKIVILDAEIANPGDLSWSELEALGEVVVYPNTPKSMVVERAHDAEVIIANKIILNEKTLSGCLNLKYIGLLSTGYNLVDIEYTSKRGIIVSNVPHYSSYGVAQHTFALLLEITNQVGHHSRAVREGRWNKNDGWSFWDKPLTELYGKTFGVVGFGSIGQTSGKIAKAFGMRVIATGSRPTPEGKEIGDYVSREQLLKQADIISLHCPLLPETENIINRESIKQMKDGVILLNTARGGLVSDIDLAEALHSGKIRAAGLDVASKEPIPEASPLRKAPNCFITPHIAWVARETRSRLLGIVAANLKAFQDGQPQNVVSQL